MLKFSKLPYKICFLLKQCSELGSRIAMTMVRSKRTMARAKVI